MPLDTDHLARSAPRKYHEASMQPFPGASVNACHPLKREAMIQCRMKQVKCQIPFLMASTVRKPTPLNLPT